MRPVTREGFDRVIQRLRIAAVALGTVLTVAGAATIAVGDVDLGNIVLAAAAGTWTALIVHDAARTALEVRNA